MRTCGLPLLVALAAGCGPEALVSVPNATRLAELANGDLLVGTSDGRLVGVNAFGDSWLVEDELGAAVQDISANAIGVWWVLLEDGRLLRGTPWAPAREERADVLGMTLTCEGLTVGTRTAPGAWADAAVVALGPACGTLALGTRDGHIGPDRVTDTALVRLFWQGEGYLWVDDTGRAGCHGCGTAVPAAGVLDAWTPHNVPFLEGEFVWLDRDGTLWIR